MPRNTIIWTMSKIPKNPGSIIWKRKEKKPISDSSIIYSEIIREEPLGRNCRWTLLTQLTDYLFGSATKRQAFLYS